MLPFPSGEDFDPVPKLLPADRRTLLLLKELVLCATDALGQCGESIPTGMLGGQGPAAPRNYSRSTGQPAAALRQLWGCRWRSMILMGSSSHGCCWYHGSCCGPCWCHLFWAYLDFSPGHGSSWGLPSWAGTSTGHDGGRGCIFLVGVRSNTICLGMGTASSWIEIPRLCMEMDLLQVCDS